jgi:ABC-type transporter Mla subunit MlaD
MPNLDSQTVQLIIVAAVAITMLLQAIVLVAGLVIARKALVSLQEKAEDVRDSIVRVTEKVEPIVDEAHDLFLRNTPKVDAAISDLAALAENLHKETTDIQAAAADVTEKLRRQGARIDAMLTNIFNVIDKASAFMTEAVSKPMRQIAGILASAKAVVDTLRSGVSDTQPPDDQAQ